MMDEIVNEVRNQTQFNDDGIAVFGKGYKSFKFSTGNFKKIQNSSVRHKIFVDGGNCEIVRTPGFVLQFVRTAAVRVQDNKFVESEVKEFYLLASAAVEQEKPVITCKFYDNNGLSISRHIDGSSDLKSACDSVRKTSEISFACEMIKKFAKCDIILLDGTLQAMSNVESELLDRLYSLCLESKTLVGGLAKTSGIVTQKGNSYTAILNQREGSWYYYPATEMKLSRHMAEILFVKLHEKSRHVFRAEIFNGQKEHMDEFVFALKDNSNDLTFPGYPYGLVLADRLARVSEREAECLRIKLFPDGKWNNLKISEAALDSHHILDSM